MTSLKRNMRQSHRYMSWKMLVTKKATHFEENHTSSKNISTVKECNRATGVVQGSVLRRIREYHLAAHHRHESPHGHEKIRGLLRERSSMLHKVHQIIVQGMIGLCKDKQAYNLFEAYRRAIQEIPL